MTIHDDRAEALAEVARAYAHRREHHISHTGHTEGRLLEALAKLLERKVTWLEELKALADAVAPYAKSPEHVEGLGAPYERARRAIAKAEGRCQAPKFADLPPPCRHEVVPVKGSEWTAWECVKCNELVWDQSSMSASVKPTELKTY